MLAALVGWWIASRVTRPVTRLTAATEAIAESGRLDVDVPAGGSDETGRLAHSFAMMLDALRRSREQQQRLAQDAGHELRTPLTSLRTNVEVLRRHPELEPATRDRVLGDIHSELRELTVVTNELVALATEEADDEPTQAVDVDALARRAAREDRAATPSHGRGRCRALVRERSAAPAAAGARQPARQRGEVRSVDGADRGRRPSGNDHGPRSRRRDRSHGSAPGVRPLLPGAERAGAAGIGAGAGDRQRRGPPARRAPSAPANHPDGRGAHHHLAADWWTQASPARRPHRRSRRPMGRRRCLTRRLPEPDRPLTRSPEDSVPWLPDRPPEPSRPPTTEMPAASDSAGSRAGSPPVASPVSASSRWSRRRPLLRRRCHRRRPWSRRRPAGDDPASRRPCRPTVPDTSPAPTANDPSYGGAAATVPPTQVLQAPAQPPATSGRRHHQSAAATTGGS